MKQKSHTRQSSIAYHRCPDCGKIIESRRCWEYRMGRYLKEEKCPRCGKEVVFEKSKPPPLGPFLGEPTTAEIEWR